MGMVKFRIISYSVTQPEMCSKDSAFLSKIEGPLM